METRVLMGLTALFCIFAAASLVIYWFVICRRLYKNGAKFPTGLLPWRLFDELRRYRELCRAASDSLSPYYIYILIFIFSVGLGLVVLLAYISKQTSLGT